MRGGRPAGYGDAVSEAAIEFNGLSKSFGKVQAVHDLSFSVEFGRVTGFLGPNGAGKSTTLRTLLGLIHPHAGTATFGGVRYERLPHPSAHVGAGVRQLLIADAAEGGGAGVRVDQDEQRSQRGDLA